MESGGTTRCMEGESLPGQMEGSTKESTLKTRSKDKALSTGLMEESTWDSGPMGNSMAGGHSWLSMDRREMGSGTMEREQGGWMKLMMDNLLFKDL